MSIMMDIDGNRFVREEKKLELSNSDIRALKELASEYRNRDSVKLTILEDELESIPTEEFGREKINYKVGISINKRWFVDNTRYMSFYGIKFYTKENAEKVVRILNRMEDFK